MYRRARLLLTVALIGLLPAVSPPPATAAPTHGRLSGLVTNEVAVPLPGASVALSPASGGAVARVVTADAAGRYQADVPRGAYDLAVSADTGGRRWAARVEDVEVAAESTLDIALVRSVRFQGTVRDAAGQPVGGVTVALHSSGASMRTGADGAFSLSVNPGRYQLEVNSEPPGTGYLNASVADFDVAGDRTADLLFPLSEFRVRVSTGAGARVPGATVHISGGYGCSTCRGAFDLLPGHPARTTSGVYTRTDADGMATLSAFPASDLTARVSGDFSGGTHVYTQVVPVGGAAPAVTDVVLRPTVALTGRMTIFGQPARYASAYLSNEEAISSGGGSQSDGRYVTNMPAGRYSVQTYLSNDSGGHSRSASVGILDFELPAGGRTLDVDIPGTPFSVRVVDSAGDPVAGAQVGMTGDYYAPVRVEVAPGVSAQVTGGSFGTTGPDGVFAGTVVAGTPSVQLYVHPPEGMPAMAAHTGTVTTSPEGAVVTLVGLGRLTGRLRDAALNPIAGVSVGWANASNPYTGTGAQTDSEGRFSMAAAPGRGTLTVNRYYPMNEAASPATPTGTWLFTSEIDFAGSRELELTTPAALDTKVRVVGTDGKARKGRLSVGLVGTLDTSLAEGVSSRLTANYQQVSGDGTFRPQLFGAGRYTIGWSPPGSTSNAQVRAAGVALDGDTNLVLAVAEPTTAALPVDPGGGPTTTTEPPAGGGSTMPPTTGGTSGGGHSSDTTPNGSTSAPGPDSDLGRASTKPGYWMLAADGQVYPFGSAERHGDVTTIKAADLAPTPTGKGYWVVNEAGVVGVRGDARHLGNAEPTVLARGEKVTSLSATPDGTGYWIFTTRGRALPFGTARFLGDVSEVTLNGPVLDSVPTLSGNGYYMVASDGGIFTFGDARYAGSMGGQRLNAPVQSLVPDGDGDGYWLVASDGGIFAFDAPFNGSLGAVRLNRPITGMVRYGDGYLMVGEDGGIFNFSNLPFSGSLGGSPPAAGVVSVAAVP